MTDSTKPGASAESYVRRAINSAVFGIPAEAIAAVQEQVSALIAEAELRGQRSRDAELLRARRILVGLNAPCKSCGDSIQKCFYEQCCMGCNHTSDQLPPALRHMEGCCE